MILVLGHTFKSRTKYYIWRHFTSYYFRCNYFTDNIGGGVAGVVQQSRLNDINPDDIESISVLAQRCYLRTKRKWVLVIIAKRLIAQKDGVNAKLILSVETINAE